MHIVIQGTVCTVNMKRSCDGKAKRSKSPPSEDALWKIICIIFLPPLTPTSFHYRSSRRSTLRRRSQCDSLSAIARTLLLSRCQSNEGIWFTVDCVPSLCNTVPCA